jgi:hypothetical protein
MALKPKFEPKDLVLAKMPGYPPWPAYVMPDSEIPPSVLKAKKKTANYCVVFIPDGDFYWMNEKNLEKLSRQKLSSKIDEIPSNHKPSKKSSRARTTNVNDALLATKMDFDQFMDSVFNNDEDDEEDEEEEDEEQEDDVADEGKEEQEINILDESDEEEEEEIELSKTKSNQRKSKFDPDESDPRALRKRRREEELENSRKKIKNEKKDSSNLKSETNGKVIHQNNNKLRSPLNNKPPITEEEKQQQLWLCRIKLQRSLIQRNQPSTPKDTKGLLPPSADELSVARLILYRLIDFPISLELLRKTKIHKVLKCITKDEELEYADSFKLHERCNEVLSKWDDLIQKLKLEKQKGKTVNDDSEISTVDQEKGETSQ